ncbi:hypothetical protein LINPERHAP2_LOCUS22889 [Linum perenne]
MLTQHCGDPFGLSMLDRKFISFSGALVIASFPPRKDLILERWNYLLTAHVVYQKKN